jgi:hypothetical protein
MNTGVKVDESTDKGNSHQIQETACRTNDDERQCLKTTKNGGKKPRASSMVVQFPRKTEMRNTTDNVKQSTDGASGTSYEQSSRKTRKGY